MSYFETYNETARLLAPYLGLRPTQIFPMSLESAPFLFSVWFGFVTICYVFVSNSIKDHAGENTGSKCRKDNTLKNLRNLIFLENARLAKKTSGKDSHCLCERDARGGGVDIGGIEGQGVRGNWCFLNPPFAKVFECAGADKFNHVYQFLAVLVVHEDLVGRSVDRN